MANGSGLMDKNRHVSAIFHTPSAMSDAFFSIQLVDAGARLFTLKEWP
jgi:hypothetical protein